MNSIMPTISKNTSRKMFTSMIKHKIINHTGKRVHINGNYFEPSCGYINNETSFIKVLVSICNTLKTFPSGLNTIHTCLPGLEAPYEVNLLQCFKQCLLSSSCNKLKVFDKFFYSSSNLLFTRCSSLSSMIAAC
jgi:hypothetical protein